MEHAYQPIADAVDKLLPQSKHAAGTAVGVGDWYVIYVSGARFVVKVKKLAAGSNEALCESANGQFYGWRPFDELKERA